MKDEKRIANQQKALEMYSLLADSFGKIENGKPEHTSEDYPEYYAGAYLDDEGKLVVLVSN